MKREWLYMSESATLELHWPGGFAWIMARPGYCDRGHWQLNVDAPSMELDLQDGFPRYFMDLEAAVREAEAFIAWRKERKPHRSREPSPAAALAAYGGRVYEPWGT